jgi:drug/metabolite transporter (DMT)-like permease
MNRSHTFSILQALLAAVLFGASAPLAKLLLGEISPVTLAGLLYLGSGLGVLLVKLIQSLNPSKANQATPITRPDLKWLLGSVIAGGVIAPIVLLVSLRQTPASTASLLLNFEGVATTTIAVLVFREAVSRRALWAAIAVAMASILLTWDSSGEWGISLGALGILGACVLWGIDNNFTRMISARDPLTIVLVKGLGAGTFSSLLSLLIGNPLPPLSLILGALLLGSISYGMSIVLFILAMRGLGASRSSAVFGISPLAGVLLSLLIFRDPVNTLFLIALPLIVFAIGLLLTEPPSDPVPEASQT